MWQVWKGQETGVLDGAGSSPGWTEGAWEEAGGDKAGDMMGKLDSKGCAGLPGVGK